MNYPVWQLEFLGGGFLIAVIAIIHVYIAQFAVGGGLFLVLTEHLAYRRNDQGILDFVRKHTKFFLLLTMVAGALTGVGIWFTISVLNPSATSTLIHTFVFAFGTEWTFFVAEIVSLFIYYYTFDRLTKRNHLTIGWIYFGAAWMSLFVINGIIDFMLTPGAWVENNNFWSGFFNPTFWPALFFRTFFSVIIAGLFGFMTSSFLKDEELRTTMLRYSAKWLLVPFVLFLASSWWYRAALPPHIEVIIFQKMPQLRPFITLFLVCSGLIILGGLVMAIRMPSGLSRTMAAVMLVIGLMYFGAFEFLREGGRRPYIIYDYMYSNAILKNDLDSVAEAGILNTAKWVEHRHVTPANVQAAGRELFDVLCLSCHSIGGPLNDISRQVRMSSPEELNLIFATMGWERPYMPPFAGNEFEKQILINYLNTTIRR
ncbi:MAG: cytochrome ubiquinol oxidase subunit I [Deltaproteobacteria bacterium]|jgi:cytochrome bd-type quinol oxidase subunit 1|nr:cytochrome ubiquinol oxidase subunit I [Deltaproteobacteria bacterium]